MRLGIALLLAVTAHAAPGVVTGTVVDAATGKPLAGVEVASVSNQTRRTKTDSQGQFVVENLPTGEQTLFAEKTATHNPGNVRVKIVEGKDPAPVVIRMPPAGILRGRVVDPDGNPLANAVVSLRSRSYRQGRLVYSQYSATTNAAGEFRISLRPGYKYDLWITPRQTTFQSPAPETEDDREAAPATLIRTVLPGGAIDIGPGENPEMRVEVQRARTACVHLLSDRSTRVEWTLNEVLPGQEAWVTHGQLPAGSTGVICGLPPGAYRLWSMQEATLTVPKLHSEQRFEVIRPKHYRLPPIHMVPGTSIEGIVNGPELQDFTVILQNTTGGSLIGESTHAVVQADGRFRFETLFHREYWLETSGLKHPFYIRTVTHNGHDALRHPVQRGSGELKIQLGRDGAALQAMEPKGALTVALACQATEPTALNEIQWTTASTLTNLPPGCYRAFSTDTANIGRISDPALLGYWKQCGVEFTLPPNSNRTAELPYCPLN